MLVTIEVQIQTIEEGDAQRLMMEARDYLENSGQIIDFQNG